MTSHDDGTITPTGRFARIEDTLNRIESKLDLKADESRVKALETRHEMLSKFVDDVMGGRIVSPMSADYLKRFTDLENHVEALQLADSNKEAVARAVLNTANTRYRLLMWAVGIATVLNFAFAAVLAIASL